MNDLIGQVAGCGRVVTIAKRFARSLLFALIAGCASLSSAQDRVARLPEAGQALLEARRAIDAIDPQEDEIKILARLFTAAWQVHAGDIPGALETMPDDPIAGFSNVSRLGLIAMWQRMAGDQAGYERSIEQALMAAVAIEKTVPRASALAEIAEHQMRAGDGPGGRKTAALIEDARQRELALAGVEGVKAQAGSGSVRLRQILPDDPTLASVLRPLEVAAARTKAGDLQAAAIAMRQAQQAAVALNDRDPLSRFFAVAIVAAALAEAGDVQGATAWVASVGGDPLVKVCGLVGVAAGLLQPLQGFGDVPQAAVKRLFPRWAKL